MRQSITYGLLILTLMLSVTAINAHVWEKKLNVEQYLLANENQTSSQPKEGFAFTLLNNLFISTGINTTYSRVQTVVTKTDMGYQSSRIPCMSVKRQLYTTKSIYVSFYAGKQMWGYYIYALRKFLI